MPFLTSLRRALPAVTLLAAVATAQTCYYPDGKTVSKDVPCNSEVPDSACCGDNSFCLGGGLCLTGGIVSRGSCTDSTWGSQACSGYCKEESEDGEIAITPCTQGESSNTFVCGLDNGKCGSKANTFWLSSDSGLVLRPSQIAALVAPALASSSSAAQTVSEPSDRAFYTPGAMAGLAAGVAIPLLIICGVLSFMLAREKKRWGPNRHMYKLPDNCKEEKSDRQPPPTITQTEASLSTNGSRRTSRSQSERPTVRSMPSYGTPVTSAPGSAPGSPRPPLLSPSKQSFVERPSNTTSFIDRTSRIQSFAERFGALKSSSASIVYSPEGMHELDSSPAPDKERFELATQRMST